jgi:HPt (histidine-containing phosphotransfer) domain-containing protein
MERTMADDYRVTDPQALYQAVGGDAAACRVLADLYLESAASTRAALQLALAQHDGAALRRQCHALRGSAVVLGAAALAAQLAACEANLAAHARLPDAAAQAALFALLELVDAEVARSRLAWGAA